MRNLFPRISFGANRPFFLFTSSSHDGKLKRGRKKGQPRFFRHETKNKLDTAPTSSPNPANHTHTPRTLPGPRSRPRYSSAASSRVCYFCAVFYLILFLVGTRRIKYKNNSFWNVQRVCVVTILESVGGLSSRPVSRCVRESVKRHSPAPVVLWCPIHRNGRWKKRISVCVGWWCDQESFDSRTLFFFFFFLCVLRFLGSRAPESWWATCRYLLLLRIVKKVAWYLNSGKVNRMNKVDDTLLLDDEVWPLVPPICETLTTYLTSWINYSSLDWVV